MNHNTVRALMREILAFLDVADSEFKAYMCSSIATNAARYETCGPVLAVVLRGCEVMVMRVLGQFGEVCTRIGRKVSMHGR